MQSVAWLEFAESGFGQGWYYFEKCDQFSLRHFLLGLWRSWELKERKFREMVKREVELSFMIAITGQSIQDISYAF